MHRLRTLHLFAGAGGGILADLLLGHQPVCAVEINAYRQQVLSARQKDGIFPWFPIFGDVTKFDGTKWRGLVDVVCAGFPCQPFSVAGPQRGDGDERNMWPETIRIIREVGPGLCLLENVPGLISNGYFGTVLGDLADAGYDAEWDIVSAADVGAPHLRRRLWILAYSENIGQERAGSTRDWRDGPANSCCEAWIRCPDCDDFWCAIHKEHVYDCPCPGIDWWAEQDLSPYEPVPNTVIERLEGEQQTRAAEGAADGPGDGSDPGWWETESGILRVADVLANRTQRIAATGDGQVPICAAVAFCLLAGIEPPRVGWDISDE